MTPRTASSQEKVVKALAPEGHLAVSEIAKMTGLAPSTVRRAIAGLAGAGLVNPAPGEGRQPTRWSVGASTDRPETVSSTERLRPGQLDGLVLDLLTDRSGEPPLGATAIAKGLGRSTGAVGNCLVRLVDRGSVRQVGERPRRYELASQRASSAARASRSKKWRRP